jgi:hypothetical protein
VGKASRKKRLRGEDSDAPSVAPEPPESTPPLPPRARWLLWASCASVAIGALLAFTGAGALNYSGLVQCGLVLSGLSACAATYASIRKESAPPHLWLLALSTGCLGFAALMRRHPELHHGVFSQWHAHFIGMPSELAYIGVAAAAMAVRAQAANRLAWWTFAASGLWALATLWMPHFWLGDLTTPFARAAEAGEVIPLLLLLPLLAWAGCIGVALKPRTAGRTWVELPMPLLAGAASGVLLIAAHHGLMTWPDSSHGVLTLGLNLTLAGLAMLLALAGACALSAGPALSTLLGRPSLDRLACAVLLTLYAALKIHGMGPSNTDENIYFYMAEALSRGEWPYQDYFFAHPPLHVVVPGAVMAVVGFSFTLAKSFSVIASAVTAFAIWSIGREHLGRVAGLTAMGAFLFAAETLKASTNMTGINLTTMWLMLGLWQSLRGRGWTAGALFGLAACTGFYSMGAICAALALGAFSTRRFALRQLISFALVAGAINALFYALGGDAYLDGVYRYHGLKATREAGMAPLFGPGTNPLSALLQNLTVMVDAKPFTRDVFYHSHLWLAGLVVPLLGAASWLTSPAGRVAPWRFLDPRRLWRDGEHGVIGFVWLIALALFIQYAMFRELYSFYFVLIYPALALCLGWSLWHGVVLLNGAVSPGPEDGLRGLRASIGVIGVALLCLWPAWSAHANKAFPSEQTDIGKRHDYTWRPAPVAEPLSDIAEALFWEDHRLRGNIERGYRHYLWTKKRPFSKAPEIAAWIAEHSAPDETIAGASGVAPLIALLADRRLAAGEADTNSKRFKAARALEREGAPPHETTTRLINDVGYWNAICADNVRFLVSTSRSYFTDKKLQRMRTIQRWFRKAKVFWDTELKYNRRYPIVLYERTGEPLPDGSVCRWE